MVREHARRLNRTSLSSIHSQQSATSQYDTIPVELARQYAQTAAMIAYLRSQPSNANMSLRGDRRGDGSSKTISNNIAPNPARHDSKGLRRQQSVRFVGVNGLERRESLTRPQASLDPRQDSAPLEPIAMTTNTPVPAIYRPPSRTSSIGKASVKGHASFAVATNAFHTNVEEDIFSTPSSYRRLRHSKSMFSPSKAPSVFYTNGTPKTTENNKVPKQHSRSQSHTPSSQPSQRALRGFKSTSLLHDRQQQEALIERCEAEIQQARDLFFQEEHKQRLRARPSFLFRSNKEKQDKPFRKSVRAQSSTELDSPGGDTSGSEHSKRKILKAAARKASKSIKTTFRRVFGRSKDEPMAIPNQQVEARETHVRHYNGDSTPAPEAFEGFSDIPHPDESTLSRVASRVPSIHTATSNQQLRSHAGSVNSFNIDQNDDKSRVTIANDNANAAQGQASRTPIGREQQRLSVINETGTHHPSSSYRRSQYKHINQASAYPKIPFPLPSVRGEVKEAANASGPNFVPQKSQRRSGESQRSASSGSSRSAEEVRDFFDELKRQDAEEKLRQARRRSNTSQRSTSSGSNISVEELQVIFLEKARQEKLREQQQKREKRLNKTGKTSRENLKPNKLVRRGSNSIASTPATIRRVPPSLSSHGQTSNSSFNQWSVPESSHSSGDNVIRHRALKQITNQPAGQEYDPASDDVFSPKEKTENKENIPLKQQETRNASGFSLDSLKRAYDQNTQAYLDLPDPVGMSPQKLANRIEGFVPEPKVLRESRSTFFGGSSLRTHRKLSPYRRYMAELRRKSDGSSTTSMSIVAQPISNPLYQASSLDIPTDVTRNVSYGTYSESIYSRTTSGRTPVAANSAISLPLVEVEAPEMRLQLTAPGKAVMNKMTVYTPTGTSGSGYHATSSASSQEWKKSTSFEVARLERTKENNTTPTYINYALPTLPKSYGRHVREAAQINDDDVHISQGQILTHQPLGIISQKSLNIQNAPLKSILKKPSFDFSMLHPPVPELPPPIPPRSPLRKLSKNSLEKVLNERRKRITSENDDVDVASVGVLARGGDTEVPVVPADAPNSWFWDTVTWFLLSWV